MSKRFSELLVDDIPEAIEKIERYSGVHTAETFAADDKSADAIVRNLEIIGEAASCLPDDFKAGHPEIEWSKIVGLRHRIVHDYFGLDMAIIWNILQRDLPVFKTAIGGIRIPPAAH